MQIVILAAGFGRRLQPITNTIPKCMVEVHGKPLLLNHLEKALKYKPDRIVIITGHKADYIRNAVGSSYMGVEVVYVDNPDYETTNNIYSLWLARDYFDDDTLMTECDLYHKGAPFEALVAARSDCRMLLTEYDPSIMDGTVVSVESGKVTSLYTKKHQFLGFDFTRMYKTVNMYRFSADFISKLGKYMGLYIREKGTSSYYELIIGEMIYLRMFESDAVIIGKEHWAEIDDAKDLKRAEEMFM